MMKKTKRQLNQNLQLKKKKRSSSNNPPLDSQLTLAEHLRELRSRLFKVVLLVLVGGTVGFSYVDTLIAIVMKPLGDQKLVYLTPGGGFSFVFTVALYFGILVAIPAITYHLYKFLQPVMREASRKLVVFTIFASFTLAIIGASFGYFVTIPAALDFLSTFAGNSVIPNLTAESYLNFVVSYVVGLAALFQLPLFLILFDRAKPIEPGKLASSQRFVIAGSTVMAAVITPTPDAFNMMLVALPIIFMYQVGVVAVYIRHRNMRVSVRVNSANTDAVKTTTPMQIQEPEAVAAIPDSVVESLSETTACAEQEEHFAQQEAARITSGFEGEPTLLDLLDGVSTVDTQPISLGERHGIQVIDRDEAVIVPVLRSGPATQMVMSMIDVEYDDIEAAVPVRFASHTQEPVVTDEPTEEVHIEVEQTQTSEQILPQQPAERVIKRRKKRDPRETVDEPWLHKIADFNRKKPEVVAKPKAQPVKRVIKLIPAYETPMQVSHIVDGFSVTDSIA